MCTERYTLINDLLISVKTIDNLTQVVIALILKDTPFRFNPTPR